MSEANGIIFKLLLWVIQFLLGIVFHGRNCMTLSFSEEHWVRIIGCLAFKVCHSWSLGANCIRLGFLSVSFSADPAANCTRLF